MTSRERLQLVFNGEIPDRVPVSLFVQEEFLSYYYPNRDKIRRLEEAVDCANELDFDLMVRGKEFEMPHFMKKSFINWELNSYTEKYSGNIKYIFEIKTPKGMLRQVEIAPDVKNATGGIHRSTIEYLIKDEKDLEVFKAYAPKVDRATINEMQEYGIYARKVVGERGLIVPWGWAGAFNQASAYRNIEDLMIDPLINEDFYREYMQALMEMILNYNEPLIQSNIDVFGIQGNIANAGMISKDFFDEFILPYEKQLVDLAKSYNKNTIYHNCGKAKKLLKSYVEMGLTAWETISEDPQGDNDLKEAKDSVGDDIVLVGNIDQIDFLKNATLYELEEKVKYMMSVAKKGGKYIFSGSDFLEKNTPIENIKYVIKCAKEYGKY